MPENGKKNPFTDNETTNKEKLMIFDCSSADLKGTISLLDPAIKYVMYSVYLPVKNLEWSSKKGQQWSEKQKQSTNNVFLGGNGE